MYKEGLKNRIGDDELIDGLAIDQLFYVVFILSQENSKNNYPKYG